MKNLYIFLWSANLIWPNGPFKYYASGIHKQLNTNVLVDFKNLNTPHLWENFLNEVPIVYSLLIENWRDSVTRSFASGFFHESVSPKPMSIPLGPFRIFSKIRGDIRSSRLTTGINDTGGKFATGVVDKQWE